MNALWIVWSVLLGIVAVLALLAGLLFLLPRVQFRRSSRRHLVQLGPAAPILEIDGQRFRDLNKNGVLDAYEDPRRPIEERVEDLLGQMTLEEKVGMLYQPMIGAAPDGSLIEAKPRLPQFTPTSEFIVGRHIVHFNTIAQIAPQRLAAWHNRLQKMAERTRLGIPVSISSDPRHSSRQNLGAAIATSGFSQWPDPIGLAATRDEALVREFGDIARQEYLATGIRVALHPMADLATDPRWGRTAGTFGEDAELASRLTVAYIQGFQGETLGPESISCMIKHFPGGGPQKDGLDAHFSYGREQAYPGGNFDYHLIPFERAFAETGVEQVMPYYGIPVDQTGENVGMSFNKDVITGLLREKYGYDGVICSDWMICEAPKLGGMFKIMDPTAWGVEDLAPIQRYRKALEAGIDQFGGQHQTERILDLVRTGQIGEARIDQSVRRLLRVKFKLGLFDDPYVDSNAAAAICGQAAFRDKGRMAQLKSVTLLKNGDAGGTPPLPLSGRPKLYLENVDPEVAAQYGEVVETPEQADLALLRLVTPWRRMGRGFLEKLFHQGDLDFEDAERARIVQVLQAVPSVVDIYLDRGAVIPEISQQCAALLASFGAPDDVILDVVFGRFNPCGKLPIEMPRSMEAVRAQKEDLPYDSENPLYPFGHGLSYDQG